MLKVQKHHFVCTAQFAIAPYTYTPSFAPKRQKNAKKYRKNIFSPLECYVCMSNVLMGDDIECQSPAPLLCILGSCVHRFSISDIFLASLLHLSFDLPSSPAPLLCVLGLCVHRFFQLFLMHLGLMCCISPFVSCLSLVHLCLCVLASLRAHKCARVLPREVVFFCCNICHTQGKNV